MVGGKGIEERRQRVLCQAGRNERQGKICRDPVNRKRSKEERKEKLGVWAFEALRGSIESKLLARPGPESSK
jgi:hypothetical protein